MGLIKTGCNIVQSMVNDQYRGVYAVDAMYADVLAVRAGKRVWGRRNGTKVEESSVITNGSVIVVGEGQCMIVTNQGKVAEVCAVPGEFLYDKDGEPSLLYDEGGDDNTRAVMTNLYERLSFGNVAPREQRVYFINTKEITGNKYGTPNPIPFRLTDPRLGYELDISLRCFGEYSYRITDPLRFFENVCGNMADTFRREALDGQLRTELLTGLQAAFARLSASGVWYSDLPSHTTEITESLSESLSTAWREKRGISIVTFGISSVSVVPEDVELIRALQRKALLDNGK